MTPLLRRLIAVIRDLDRAAARRTVAPGRMPGRWVDDHMTRRSR